MEKLVKITAIGLVIPTLLVLMWALIQWGNAGKSAEVAINSLPETMKSVRDTMVVVNSSVATIGSGVNNTLNAVNHPCAPGPCGLLANANKVTTKIGDIVVTSQMQVRQTDKLVSAAVTSIQESTKHIDKTSDAATKLIADTDVEIKPVIENTNKEIIALGETNGDINTFLKSKYLFDSEDHIANIIANGDKMVAIGEQVEDKATHSYLHPSKNPFVRTWNVVNPFLVSGAKITAAVF
jgi:hypothetical protein